MASRKVSLQVETLEDRSVPSANPLDSGVVMGWPVQQVAAGMQQSHPLAGLGHGTFSSQSLVADTGESYQLSGGGHFGKLGDARVSGSLHGIGFVQQGKAEGSLTFTNGHGSVTIALEGPVQPGFSSMPNWFNYHVTSATGTYKDLKDHGTIRIDYHFYPIMNPLAHAPVTMPATFAAGTFRIAI